MKINSAFVFFLILPSKNVTWSWMKLKLDWGLILCFYKRQFCHCFNHFNCEKKYFNDMELFYRFCCFFFKIHHSNSYFITLISIHYTTNTIFKLWKIRIPFVGRWIGRLFLLLWCNLWMGYKRRKHLCWISIFIRYSTMLSIHRIASTMDRKCKNLLFAFFIVIFTLQAFSICPFNHL